MSLQGVPVSHRDGRERRRGHRLQTAQQVNLHPPLLPYHFPTPAHLLYKQVDESRRPDRHHSQDDETREAHVYELENLVRLVPICAN